MRQSAFVRFLGFAIAASALAVACGGDDDDDGGSTPAPVVKSGEGESCQRTDDCEDGLGCFNNVCYEDPTPPGTGGTGGSSGGTGGTGTGGTNRGGSGGTAQNPGRLSGEGESCAKTSDCATGLSCFNMRCSMSPDAEGGEANMPTPVLGSRGETCVLTTDCQQGLVCLPSGGIGSVGVCSPIDSGVSATGKTCFAECSEAEDCCELPIELHAQLAVKSCTELEALLEGVDCAGTAVVTDQQRCFALTAYCDCGSNTWRCTDGSCEYIAACEADGLVPGGCATVSRSGRSLNSTCDVDDSDRCRLPVEPTCEEDDDCIDDPVFDDPTDVCVDGECTCWAPSICLRKCDNDLDCSAGKSCQDNVCVPSGTCSDDVTCQLALGDYRATCSDGGVCTLPCEVDVDCNGLTGGTFKRVCEEGMCVDIGCTSDSECMHPTDLENPRRMFCLAPPEGGTDSASSAITD